MRDCPNRRGAAPVARLDDLPEIEAGAVLMLRARCDAAGAAPLRGTSGRADPARRLEEAETAFDAFLSALAEGARRPLARHAAACRCVGGDEAAVARLVADAADGAREDAMLTAVLLARPHHAARLVDLAAQAGFALGRLSRGLAAGAPSALLH